VINNLFLQQALLTRPLGIGSKGRFLNITISEKKNGFLLIEIFEKLFVHKTLATWINSGWPFFYLSGSVKSVRNSGHHKLVKRPLAV